MKKVILLTLAALVLMSGAAFATESRIRALGMYTAPYICDDANIFSWYATLPSYSNLVVMTMWNADDMYDYDYWYDGDPEDGGFEDFAAYYAMTYALGDEGSWGTLGMLLTQGYPSPNQNEWMVDEIYGEWYDDDIDDILQHHDVLENKWALMYGYAMEKMSFGLFFSRSSEKYKYIDVDTSPWEEEYTYAYTTLGLGFRMEITEDMTGEVAFDYTKVTKTYDYIDSDEAENSWDEEMDPGKVMAIRARAGYNWSEDIMLIGYVNWASKDFAMTLNTDDPGDEYYSDEGFGYKEMDFTFGIGANLTVNEDNMILFAVEPYSMVKVEPSGYTEGYTDTWEMKYRAMPRFILALESDLTDWLTFRTGISKDLGKYCWKWDSGDDPENSEEEEYTNWPGDGYGWNSVEWNIGLGFHFGDFDIDCVVNKNVPFSMGYWLTGYGPGNDPYEGYSTTPIGMISAVYHF